MAWLDLHACILREFAEAQAIFPRRVATEEGGHEALRQAWRDRQRQRGECASCRRPTERKPKSGGRRFKYCAVHRAQLAASARASKARAAA